MKFDPIEFIKYIDEIRANIRAERAKLIAVGLIDPPKPYEPSYGELRARELLLDGDIEYIHNRRIDNLI